MVSEDEIRWMADLMKIEIVDHKEYVEKVLDMIDYFAILDDAQSDVEISTIEIPLERLREDKHVPYDDHLIRWLKGYRDGHIRAPKMV